MKRALLRDERGEASTGLLGFSLTWFVVFSVFLMNVQLGQLFHRRDVVDHAAALAADTAMKTYCASGGDKALAEREALRAIEPLLATAAAEGRDCAITLRPSEGAADPGAADLDLLLECSFSCKVPIAAQAMCKAGRVTFASKLETVSLGCDGAGGS